MTQIPPITEDRWPLRLGGSATLAVNEEVRRRRAAGLPVVNLSIGEAGLPLLPELGRRLGEAAGATAYPPVPGIPQLRDAAAGWFTRRGLLTDAGQVVVGPGSKLLLWALLASLPGDLLLPRPSWVSYASQGHLAGKAVVLVPTREGPGGVPDLDALAEVVEERRAAGEDPRILIVTIPDNPTGTVAPPDLVEELADAARSLDLIVISDEIYRELAYRPDRVSSPAEVAPDRVVVTGGLSKSLALGGWRLGFVRLPQGPIGELLAPRLLGIASETWSSVSGPIQEVAAWALGDPPQVRERVERSRRLHQAVGEAAHRVLARHGVPTPAPQAAFYLYPSFDDHRAALARRGLTTGRQLAQHLLQEHGVATVAGEAFGEPPERIRLRLSTSLIYGERDEQRLAALTASDPTQLPPIAGALAGLDRALGEVLGR